MAMTSRLHLCAFRSSQLRAGCFLPWLPALLHYAALHTLEELTLDITAGTFQYSAKGLRIKYAYCFLIILSLLVTSISQLC